MSSNGSNEQFADSRLVAVKSLKAHLGLSSVSVPAPPVPVSSPAASLPHTPVPGQQCCPCKQPSIVPQCLLAPCCCNLCDCLLLQMLGEGEFGKVKLGLHCQWGEEVAVKIIHRGSINLLLRMSKVEWEIEVLRVCHPFLFCPCRCRG